MSIHGSEKSEAGGRQTMSENGLGAAPLVYKGAGFDVPSFTPAFILLAPPAHRREASIPIPLAAAARVPFWNPGMGLCIFDSGLPFNEKCSSTIKYCS